jgi:hypothetical protein
MELRTSYLNSLYNNICFVNFTKMDGTLRGMRCTLRSDMLPPQTDLEEHTQRKQTTESIAVWDLEVKGWRSFRNDSVIDFKVLEETL